MSETRIVVERACRHGLMYAHAVRDENLMWLPDQCPGGRRRVLTAGEYLLVEKVDGEWPKWLKEEARKLQAYYDVITSRRFKVDLLTILDALAKSEQEGTE